MNISIILNSINDVKSFIKIAGEFNGDIDLISGRYIIDAKSIMGIFSLDLSKPITVSIDDRANADNFLEKIKPFIAN